MSVGFDLSEFIRQYPAVAGIVLLFITGFVRDYFQRQAFMQGARTIQEASLALIKPYQEEVGRNTERISNCEKRLLEVEHSQQRLYAGVRLLTIQLETNGLKPIWTPREWDRPVITKGEHIDYA